jgi:hypothetical protein
MGNKPCEVCNPKEIKEKKHYGPFAYRDFPGIRLITPIQLRTCGKCGEIFLKSRDSKEVDQACEGTIIGDTQKFIGRLVERHGTSQAYIAKNLLGISAVYLTELKKGDKIPSYALYNLLKLLAKDEKACAAIEADNPPQPMTASGHRR